MKKILIVIDMQNDFIDGSLGTPEAQQIVEAVKAKIRSYPPEAVFATMDTHEEDYLSTQEGRLLPVAHCIRGTEGWALRPDICVVSNALMLKAFLPEVTIRVDANCCAGVTPEAHRAALETMRSCQIEITE